MQTVDETFPTTSTPSLGFLRRLGADTAYVASGFVLGVVGFSVTVVGLSVGLGLVVVWVGLAVLAGTLWLARGLAHVERHRLARRGRDVQPTPYVEAPADAGGLRRLITVLRDPQSWLDALWSLVSFATGTTAFVAVLAWWTAAIGGVTYWWWQQWLPDQDTTLAEILGLGEGRGAESLLQLAFGVAALLTLPLVAPGCAALHAGVADTLLCTRGRVTRS